MNVYLYLVLATVGSAAWMLIIGQLFGPKKAERLVVGWSVIVGILGCIVVDPRWTGALGGALTFMALWFALYTVRCLEARASSNGQC